MWGLGVRVMASQKKTAVLFPGQGSQFVGMGKDFLESSSEARDLMAKAESISGFPLERLCLEGPMEELTQTINLQPAITVMNLICWQAMTRAGIRPDYIAGHSLGEYSSLCAAGVLSADDTLALVTERGKLMEREANRNPGGMRAVLGLTLSEVLKGLAGVSGKGVVTAANHNSEKQIVLSGDEAALDAAAEKMEDQGGRVISLKVSGAWHSALVEGAVPDFTAAMRQVAFRAPEIPLLFNVTGEEERGPDAIRSIMARQIASMVKWHDIINTFMAQEVRVFIEVGPKTVLTGLLKKILPKEYECSLFQVDTPEKIEKLVQGM